MYGAYLLDRFGVVLAVLCRITANSKSHAEKKLVSMYRETKGILWADTAEYNVGDTISLNGE